MAGERKKQGDIYLQFYTRRRLNSWLLTLRFLSVPSPKRENAAENLVYKTNTVSDVSLHYDSQN